ncbi:MAG TPA: carboxypeptidase-like regulatory domain-containing protein, partial [Pseudomonadales bacterium]
MIRLAHITLALWVALVAAGCGERDRMRTSPDDESRSATVSHIRGQVFGPAGAEAGVWVIAETDAFDTRFARIVVTDDAGRFLLPDLPAAEYRVWVRGYGLADSSPVPVARGTAVELRVSAAANPAEAARVYPAAYWYAMMHLPSAEEVSDVPGGLETYLMWMKNMACVGCHQLGQASTRTMPATLRHIEDSEAAWAQRIAAGQAGGNMTRIAGGLLRGVPYRYLADWTDRIAAGALPADQPERPTGLARNVVATVRDWSDPKAYLHDLSGTDRRNPTVNGYGPLYGAPELSTDAMPILDPVANTATTFRVPVRDTDTPSTHEDPVIGTSAYWGDERIWDSQANIHNPMLDQDGRVWLTARIRGPENPDFCRAGSDHPSARHFAKASSSRHLAVYEPASGEYRFVDTCFGTHHLQFANDPDNTLYTSGGGDVVGWLNTRRFLETGNAAAAQTWAPVVLDTNGNGRLDAWTEPGASRDPEKDLRLDKGFYAVMPNPADDSVWGSSAFSMPGGIIRMVPGAEPPATTLSEYYEPPLPGFGVRGADIDSDGVVWVSLGSGHLGAFDRRKCTGPLNGPTATGGHCPEGWTLYDLPGPSFTDLPGFSVESSYYTWVDQHDTLGLGADVPIVTGNLFDGVHALVDRSGEGRFVTLRIPYPMGF